MHADKRSPRARDRRSEITARLSRSAV